MPHRRHRVRVHVHNRYVRTHPAQQAQQNCKKRCKNGSRCRGRSQGGGEDDYDRPVQLSPTQDGRLKQPSCQRFHSAEEVCRRGCGSRSQKGGGGGSEKDGGGGYEKGGDGGYERDGGGGAGCERGGSLKSGGGGSRGGKNKAAGGCGCKRGSGAGGGSRPGTPCERFKSAEETCRGCRRPGQPQQFESVEDAGRVGQRTGRSGGPCTDYSVYTAQVQHGATTGPPSGGGGGGSPMYRRVDTGPPSARRRAWSSHDTAQITEEIIHTREHHWHIPSPQGQAERRQVSRNCEGTERDGSALHGAEPSDLTSADRRHTTRRGPCSSDGSPSRTAGRSTAWPLPAPASSSDGGRRRPEADDCVRRTRSELLAGRQLVARIARQVELEDGTRRDDQLVYHLSAEYRAEHVDYGEYGSSGSGSGSEDPEQLSESATVETVLRLERLQLEEAAAAHSSSDSAQVGSGSPQPAPRSARRAAIPAEPPSPLPRRQVTSEPALPGPPAPPSRAARSLDCQPIPPGGRAKKLRTRGALTRLREQSLTRLGTERQRQLLPEESIVRTGHWTAAKGPPDRSPDADSRWDVTVYHAQNLLPADYPAPGSRGDAGNEPIYQNADTLYDGTAQKPGNSGGPYPDSQPHDNVAQPASASPYVSRPDDPYQPVTSPYRDYGDGRSPYLETAPAGRVGRARFDDDDQLGSALYEQRYQPRRDNSPYLSRPPGRTTGTGTGGRWRGRGRRQRRRAADYSAREDSSSWAGAVPVAASGSASACRAASAH